MKNLTSVSAITLGAFLCASTAIAAPIVLTNAGFETGDLSGWTALGPTVVATPSTNVVTFDSTNWVITAHDNWMAKLNPDGVGVATIEAALGVAAGSLNALNTNANGGSITDAAAIYQNFSGNAGDNLSLFWDYVATDYIPFNDPSFAIVIAPDGSVDISVLASIHGLGIDVGTSGHSGWQEFSYDLTQTGDYKVAFVVTNDKDQVLDGVLFIDDQPGSCQPACPPPVTGIPEPATMGLLGAGLVGLAWLRRRRAA